MRKTNTVISFSNEKDGNKEWLMAFEDYYNHYRSENNGVKNLKFSEIPFSEKNEKLNNMFRKMVADRSGLAEISTLPSNSDKFLKLANNPNVRYFADEILDNTVDFILPQTLIESLGVIADFRFGGYMDSFKFDIKNNGLFTVQRAGRRQRRVPAQRLDGTTVTLAPENREVTVITNLPRLLAGRDNIGEFVMKVAISIESQLRYDVYDAFVAAMDAAPPAFIKAAYSENDVIEMCERVSAYNNGRKAVIYGTPVALKSVLPASSNNRILLSDRYVTIGSLETFNGYDVIPMAQVADYTTNNYDLKLLNDRIFIVSPASDKIVKIGIGGETLSHTSGNYSSAELSIFSTMNKAWDMAAITNSVAGVIKIA